MPTPVSIKSVPAKRLFTATQAATYLGIHRHTLPELDLPIYRFRTRKAYRIEDLEAVVEHLPPWSADGRV